MEQAVTRGEKFNASAMARREANRKCVQGHAEGNQKDLEEGHKVLGLYLIMESN